MALLADAEAISGLTKPHRSGCRSTDEVFDELIAFINGAELAPDNAVFDLVFFSRMIFINYLKMALNHSTSSIEYILAHPFISAECETPPTLSSITAFE